MGHRSRADVWANEFASLVLYCAINGQWASNMTKRILTGCESIVLHCCDILMVMAVATEILTLAEWWGTMFNFMSRDHSACTYLA
jgi:hypothetical protein